MINRDGVEVMEKRYAYLVTAKIVSGSAIKIQINAKIRQHTFEISDETENPDTISEAELGHVFSMLKDPSYVCVFVEARTTREAFRKSSDAISRYLDGDIV